jgi:hypothetical protein
MGDGLPYFSLHPVRRVMTSLLHEHVSPVASSLLLVDPKSATGLN